LAITLSNTLECSWDYVKKRKKNWKANNMRTAKHYGPNYRFNYRGRISSTVFEDKSRQSPGTDGKQGLLKYGFYFLNYK
jgi:hypothetical protein